MYIEVLKEKEMKIFLAPAAVWQMRLPFWAETDVPKIDIFSAV